MPPLRRLVVLTAFLAVTGANAQVAPPPPPQGAAPVEDLGGGRYRIGAIVVDRTTGQFVVPARVLHLDDAPLEYIAVSRGGVKGYESLLEVDARGTAFNLACILLGLEAPERGPGMQFERRPPTGPSVHLSLRWQVDGRTVTHTMQEVLDLAARPRGAPAPPPNLQRPPPPPEDWAYVGSFMAVNDQRYVADATGTLIGFVHDPASIIEHRTGLGIGAYGSVQGNPKVLPPVGTAVELIVAVPPPGTVDRTK